MFHLLRKSRCRLLQDRHNNNKQWPVIRPNWLAECELELHVGAFLL